MNSLENKECSKCQYSNNSTLMHDCAFTSAQHPPVWWCEHPNKPQYGHKIDGGNAPATCPERKEAPQPQADARDAERYRWLRAQPLEGYNSMFCTTIWRKGTDGFGDDLRLEKLDAAIDAAIAKATGCADSAQPAQGDRHE